MQLLANNMSRIYHIGRSETDRVTEGGVARDIAFSRALKEIAVRVQVGGSALKNLYTVFKFLIRPPKDSQIVLHYPNIGIHISDRFIIGRYIRRIYIFLIERLARTNILAIDVADMPCEQAIDLELPIPRHYQDIEFRLFNAATTLIPASASMQYLIKTKYPILELKKFIVCKNGGEQYRQSSFDSKHKCLSVDQTKFVYAGTLNQGRGIEQILSAFDRADATLYLLGSGGEWIPAQIKGSANVFYIGELSESDAFSFVSMCDVGLIPYDNERSYYNIAFPTKLSFYLAAGIPYLCTPVAEAVAIQNQYGCGWIYSIKDWRKFINTLASDDLESKKRLALKKSAEFTWRNTLRPFIEYLQQCNGGE